MSRLEECGVCTGSGVKAGTTASTCSTCGGQGQVVTVQRTPIGAFQQVPAFQNQMHCSSAFGTVVVAVNRETSRKNMGSALPASMRGFGQ